MGQDITYLGQRRRSLDCNAYKNFGVSSPFDLQSDVSPPDFGDDGGTVSSNAIVCSPHHSSLVERGTVLQLFRLSSPGRRDHIRRGPRDSGSDTRFGNSVAVHFHHGTSTRKACL